MDPYFVSSAVRRALEVYGSREALERAQQQQIEEMERLRDEENLTSKRVLKEFYKSVYFKL